MQIKHFTTRLSPEFMKSDQDKINAFMETVTVTKTATQFVPGNPDYWSILVFYNEKQKETITPPTVSTNFDDLTEEGKGIFTALKLWRKDQAQERNVPEFMIVHNATIMDLADKKPTTLPDLAKIIGLGPQKIARHGLDIIAIISAF